MLDKMAGIEHEGNSWKQLADQKEKEWRSILELRSVFFSSLFF